MTTNYILIDYENVQPNDVAILDGHAFKLFVFSGENQSKIPIDLVAALQPRGESVQWVPISGNGRNALDFHIALYLGELCAKDPDGHFHVISKDKGFDPLIQFLRDRGISAQRCSALSDLPFLAARGTDSLDERIDTIVRNLTSMVSARPRKRKTLASTIHAHFGKRLDGAVVEKLIDELERRKLVAIREGAVTYAL